MNKTCEFRGFFIFLWLVFNQERLIVFNTTFIQMSKSKYKQASLFSPREMRGGVKRRDYFTEDFVSAYLMYMKRVSELDDETCHRLQRACDEVAGKSVNGNYYIKTLANRINVTHFTALRDCINMRLFPSNESFFHHEEKRRYPQVTYPAAFVKARKTFKELYSAKYEGKDAWISDRSLEELIGLVTYFVEGK